MFFVTVVSDDGSPMTTFNPAAALMLLWEGVPTETAPQPKVSDLLTDRGDFYLLFWKLKFVELYSTFLGH